MAVGSLGIMLFSTDAFAQFNDGGDDPFNSTFNSFNDTSFETDQFSSGFWGAEIDEIIVTGMRHTDDRLDIYLLLKEWRDQAALAELVAQLENQPPEFIEPEEPEVNKCQLEQTVESNKDQAAQQAASTIAGMPSNNEHRALIVDNGSGPVVLPIVSGTNGSIDPASMNATMGPAGYNHSNVVGLIHSHPASGDADLDARNRAPSHDGQNPPAAGDYAYAAYMREISVDFFGANAVQYSANFTHYIVGPDGVLREFDGVDPHSSLDGDNKFNDTEAAAAEADANGDCSDA